MSKTNPTTRTRESTAKTAAPVLQAPTLARKLVDRLSWRKEQDEKKLKQTNKRLKTLQEYLNIANEVTDALETLSEKLFEEVRQLNDNNKVVIMQTPGELADLNTDAKRILEEAINNSMIS